MAEVQAPVPVQAPVNTNDRVAVIVDPVQKPAEPVKLSKADVDELQRQATAQSNYDPVEEEKMNNARMFARERIASEGRDREVEAEVGKKMIADADKEVADAQAKLDSAKAAAAKAMEEVKAKEAAEKAAAK